ncbi:hypothetical protein B0H13DRAFT_1896705 [Mycena leptocephala]|nr:hypothetical protein B0H13DRAFT_1896705 [Mycena leptocephala]
MSSPAATAYHHIGEQNIVKKSQALESLGDKKYAQARFSAKQANGLAKPSKGLASRYAGLGLGATPKSKPKPEKAVCAGASPFCKPKTSLSDGPKEIFTLA